MTFWNGITGAALVGLLISASALAWPLDEEPPQEKQKVQVYDEAAAATADVDAALARATKENRRVLVVWGANWCGWCVKLHHLFDEEPDVRRKLLYEYDVVKVDVGQFDKNMELAKRFGAAFQEHGVPYLTVLDASGNVLANQETGSLEEGKLHDPRKVLAFLEKHQTPYEKATDVRDRALAASTKAKKTLFLTFGAPW